jgi:hypothetical protein
MLDSREKYIERRARGKWDIRETGQRDALRPLDQNHDGDTVLQTEGDEDFDD